ncbi:uncharacterized protein [Typha latifolia]|uniref:uncharacterized protein n=1 Tax=Typha latifolia TaxID=4733 RepID=UPI003C30607B
MKASPSPEIADVMAGEESSAAEEDNPRSDCRDEAVADVSGNTWEVALFERSPSEKGVHEGLYVYHNTFHLFPRAIGGLGTLKTLKFFANEIEVLPPEAGNLVELERLQVKVSSPRISGIPFQKLKSLKELELCKVPPRPSAFSILSEISGLKCLTKLVICHFSIRYLPPEVGSLKKLQELDLSFNKLKNLPNSIAELSALKLLKVANNKLVDIPSGISSLRCLERLDLSNNRLTSLSSLKLSSMLTLQYLNLQFNRIPSSCQLPSWIRCDFEGNGKDVQMGEKFRSLVEVCADDAAACRNRVNHSRNDSHGTCSCIYSEVSSSLRIHATQRTRKGWKRRNYLQQRARQEFFNGSRNWKIEDDNDDMTVKMVEENNSCKLLDMRSKHSELQVSVAEEIEFSSKSSFVSEVMSSTVSNDVCSLVKDGDLTVHGCPEEEEICLNKRGYEDDFSCITTESTCLNKDYDFGNELEDSGSSVYALNEVEVVDDEASKFTLNSKRHPDRDSNPKPSKFRKPFGGCSNLSYKYNTESFCSSDDHLPDGFYDAGRDRPFMSIQEYERSLCLESREVILLDRKEDAELDAIAFSAQLLLSNFRRPSISESEDYSADDLLRASILALFVSDCFGGSDRSASLMRTRRAVVSLNKQQPFICTCSVGSFYNNSESSKQMLGLVGNLSFTDLCDKSLQIIKERRNSNVVPLGAVQLGVCRHRAVLMKYLCDRADPPIPCELVRGYLDFMPHAWNTVLVRRSNAWTRMIVDPCYPTNIREETDPEYFCRYIPLSRVNVPFESKNSSIPACSFPSPSTCQEIKSTSACSVIYCKIGNSDAFVKMRNLDSRVASNEEIRDFEYKFLGEVRLLGALRRHRCIVDIYGHQLSSKWVLPADGSKEYRLFQSLIVMEYVKGGSLKSYLEKLFKKGEKHVPVELALYIARDVACALVELHSKLIIHRDLKSENIVIDLDCKGSDGAPIVKLCDFDTSVPLQSSEHTCCIAHLGIHPPDVCIGTPRWMAPEVVQAMHQKNQYGLEVDIWSYGCFLLELLTLQIPYQGLSESEIYDLLQVQQGPSLTQELELLSSFDEPVTRLKLGISSDTDADILKLLIDLFHQCTRGNPADRPTAKHIYDSLCSVSRHPDTTST